MSHHTYPTLDGDPVAVTVREASNGDGWVVIRDDSGIRMHDTRFATEQEAQAAAPGLVLRIPMPLFGWSDAARRRRGERVGDLPPGLSLTELTGQPGDDEPGTDDE